MRSNPLAIGAVALLAAAAHAGEIKTPQWPCTSIPQEVTTIPVWLDFQPWVWVKDVDKLVIWLVRQDAYAYEGCVDVSFEAHASVDIKAEFIPNGVVPGKYTCWQDSSALDPPGGTLNICVRLETEAVPPPPTNMQVGTVIFRISPKA